MSVWPCARYPQSSHLPTLSVHTHQSTLQEWLTHCHLEKEPERSGNPIFFQNRVGLALQPESV